MGKYYQSKSFYLVGGKTDVISQNVNKLKSEFKGITIVDYRDGYINTEEDRKKLIHDIGMKKSDVVFVAMGIPIQEVLIQEMQNIHPAIYAGLDRSFDVYTGNVKRAPDWLVNNNLECACRLIHQPSRITRQIHLVRFAWK